MSVITKRTGHERVSKAISKFVARLTNRVERKATPVSVDSELTLYMYVRNSLTHANAGLNPTVIDENSAHFCRLVKAVDQSGNRVIRVDPRSIQWFFGAANLPIGQTSMAFGNRVYIAWDYDPSDPVVTRTMASELTRVWQQLQAGGEIAFARKHVANSCSELLDQSSGKQSPLKRERNGVARLWNQWWTSVGRFSPRLGCEPCASGLIDASGRHTPITRVTTDSVC